MKWTYKQNKKTSTEKNRPNRAASREAVFFLLAIPEFNRAKIFYLLSDLMIIDIR
jgi:hypothetical protein